MLIQQWTVLVVQRSRVLVLVQCSRAIWLNMTVLRECYLHSCQLLLPVWMLDLPTPKQHDKRPQSRIPLMVVRSTSNTNQLDVAKHIDSASDERKQCRQLSTPTGMMIT